MVRPRAGGCSGRAGCPDRARDQPGGGALLSGGRSARHTNAAAPARTAGAAAAVRTPPSPSDRDRLAHESEPGGPAAAGAARTTSLPAMTNPTLTHLYVPPLDRSGSMQAIKADAEVAIDAFVAGATARPGRVRDDAGAVRLAVWRSTSTGRLPRCHRCTSSRAGMTALFDAVGSSSRRRASGWRRCRARAAWDGHRRHGDRRHGEHLDRVGAGCGARAGRAAELDVLMGLPSIWAATRRCGGRRHRGPARAVNVLERAGCVRSPPRRGRWLRRGRRRRRGLPREEVRPLLVFTDAQRPNARGPDIPHPTPQDTPLNPSKGVSLRGVGGYPQKRVDTCQVVAKVLIGVGIVVALVGVVIIATGGPSKSPSA